jgi:protein phosphatase
LALPQGPLSLAALRNEATRPWHQPYRLPYGESWVRVYALSAEDYAERKTALKRRQSLIHPQLAPIWLVEQAHGAWLVAEAAEPWLPPAIAPETSGWEQLSITAEIVEKIAEALTLLHQSGLIWGSFDPHALEQGPQGLRFSNLDGAAYRAGEPIPPLAIAPAYVAPEAAAYRAEAIGPATDVFALAAYAYYRLAGLPDGLPGHGPAAWDYQMPPLRAFCPWLPLGILPVLQRGLAIDPAHRFSSVAAFAQAFRLGVESARRRADYDVPVQFQIAGGSRIGLYHQVTQLPNQDAWAIHSLPEGHLLLVADGVSYALIGSGEQASQTAVATLVRFVRERAGKGMDLLERAELLSEAFWEASRAVFDAAMAQPLGRLATDPTSLMSTTGLVGWIYNGNLLIANTGDSRAYLIRDQHVERLTVDGDVGTLHLQSGTPPEDIRAMGEVAGWLYRCLGVATQAGDSLCLDAERCLPELTHWPLLPGDTVVLCTDGLVEDGVFLDETELPALVATGSAPEVVDRLLEAACDRHREPSIEEPEGCGDDVTCIVVRVLPVEHGPD